MRDLAGRLEDMAVTIKHYPESVDDEQMDQIKGMLREAAEQLGIIDRLLKSDLKYKRTTVDNEPFMQVRLTAELDVDELSRLLEMIAERI